MLCKADQIILPGQEQVQVCGVQFRILSLPGHAASHMGFVTPDGVAYLADSMFDRESLKKGRLFYMLLLVTDTENTGKDQKTWV
ncbi:MAG: hypothetical protein ACLT4E_13225 [Clostridium sp.]